MINADFIVPCGRPETPHTLSTVNNLSEIAKSTGGRVIVVGYNVESLKERVADNVTLLGTSAPVGPAEARNLGAQQSREDLLLFVDDDCILNDDIIGRLNALYSDHDNLGVVSGRIISARLSYVSLCHDFACFGYQQARRQKWDTPLLVTAFMAVRHDLFSAVGGFDQTLRVCEDIDLVNRCLDKGWRSLYDPDIVVRHHHSRVTWKKLLGYQYWNGTRPLLMEAKNRNSWRTRAKILLQPILPLFFPILILKNVYIVIRENIITRSEVLIYVPGIILVFCAYEIGRVVSSYRSWRQVS